MSAIPKPTGQPGGISIIAWKPYKKNTLCGFLSLSLPSGMIIHDCTLHEKNNSRWIGLPGKPYDKPDGTKAYSPIIEIPNRDTSDRFQAIALAALDQYFGGGPRE